MTTPASGMLKAIICVLKSNRESTFTEYSPTENVYIKNGQTQYTYVAHYRKNMGSLKL